MSLGTENAKIVSLAVRAHARYSYMLSGNEYWTMLNLKSIAEITEFLKGTDAYGKQLKKLIPSTTHRTMLENNLRSTLFYEEEHFLNSLEDEGYYKFFLSMMRRFESDHLKNIFRRMRSHELGREALYAFLKHIPGSDVPYSRLIACSNYAELLNCLRGTAYYEVLKEPLGKLIYGETNSLFETETAIDHYVEEEVFNTVKLLDKKERDYLLPLFGARVDIYNIYNLHRCVWYYNMTTDDIIKALLPVYYKVMQKDLRDMLEQKDSSKRLEILKMRFPMYSKPFELSAGLPDAELMLETLLQRANYQAALKIFKMGTPGFHTSICYFVMKLHEMKDVIKIIEAVRYEYLPADAAKYLTRPVLDGGASNWL